MVGSDPLQNKNRFKNTTLYSSGMKGKGMKLRFRPYDLELIHVFAVSSYSRSTSPVVLVEIEYDGIIGYGEASVPPYLHESRESVIDFLQKADLGKFPDPLQIEDILEYIDQLAPGNHAAKASLDIALHDLVGKLTDRPLYSLWDLDPDKTPYTSITLGIDTPEMLEQKARELNKTRILKIKLGSTSDMELIKAVRKVTDKPLYVDINQGWTDKHKALEMIFWLKDQGVVMVEQPMPVGSVDEMAWLTQYSPLPTIADEAVQGIADVEKITGIYNGINIKLMKCGGLHAARQMVDIAQKLNLEIMIGCMVETSCAVSAAAHLSPLAGWCDLDGNQLIKNDVFNGVKIVDGKIVLPERPGIGVVPIELLTS
jgi:L-Ala-D/L-Glu epimerase